jgi:antitoxin (DNA-binding transcriptional repressor) of toxin-antitoxin stability system
MIRTISQRELRNGTPVAELRPLSPRRLVPRERLAQAASVAPRIDARRFRADVDAFIELCGGVTRPSP